MNWRPREGLQLSVHSGAKLVREFIAAQAYQGFTGELGVEGRYDVTPKWDVGGRRDARVVGGGQTAYSAGPSVGFNLAQNAWASAGYNLWGYDDRDFAAANYAAQGPDRAPALQVRPGVGARGGAVAELAMSARRPSNGWTGRAARAALLARRCAAGGAHAATLDEPMTGATAPGWVIGGVGVPDREHRHRRAGGRLAAADGPSPNQAGFAFYDNAFDITQGSRAATGGCSAAAYPPDHKASHLVAVP